METQNLQKYSFMARIKYKEAARMTVMRGRPAIGRFPKKSDLAKLYVRKGKSIRDVAVQLSCSKDMVSRALKAYGIKARASFKRSILLTKKLESLEAGIKEKGIRGLARELGVDESTLRHHIKVRRMK